MEDVTGATVVSMAPTGGDDVVQQLNTVASRVRVGWPAMALSLLFGLFTIPWGLLSWIILIPACIWLILWDQSRQKVVLFYDVNDEPAQWFTKVVEQWQWLSQSQALWRVIQSGAVRTTYQFKTNSGASNVVDRVRAVANSVGPQQLATNIAVPTISAGKVSLHFLPDRVLVRDGKRFSDIAYTHVGIYPGTSRFIEESAPPGDAIQVDWTWRFVNVKGGPDRRYNNNRQLPVMQYETLDFTSPEGLQWHLQISRNGAAKPIAAVLSLHDRTAPFAQPIPPARQPTTPPRPASKQQPAPPKAPERQQGNLAFELVPDNHQAGAAAPRGLTEGQLTRNKTPYPATEITYTAIDLETTGLDPQTDRIVEIGLVKFTGDGTVVDEFTTLVNNPGSSAQARSVHGIEDTELAGAPTTAQTLSEVLAFISGTVLVAHNLQFENAFLASAAEKASLQLPRVVSICTLRTSRRQLDGRAFSLKAMYKTATGEWLDRNHTALADARAVKDVLLWLLRTAPQPLYLTAVSLSTPTQISAQCPIKCRPVPLTRSSVAALLDSFPQSPNPRAGDSAAIERYKEVLAEAVEDGRLTYEEADILTRQACLTQLTGPQLRALHQQAWDLAFPEAKNNEWTLLTPTKRREMYLLAEALGLDDLAKELNQVMHACAEPEPPAQARYLRGMRVAIVGDHFEVVQLREYAESYGAKLAVNITKTVLWMASVTPEAKDSRHETARRLGIPIISPALGRQRLDESVREAELKAFERQRRIDEANAQRRRYEAEADAYWRPQWRDRELDHDPEPRYESW